MAAPHWDANSRQLLRNLAKVHARVVAEAGRRVVPHVDLARQWHAISMEGLDADGDPSLIGNFRGASGLEDVIVHIGGVAGALPEDVAAELQKFEATFQSVIAQLDERYPTAADLDVDGFRAAVDIAAWAHGEWVRIHPFANGNGRTARAWANFVLARYGIAPVIALRPRPGGAYGSACAMAMRGDWRPMAAVFMSLIKEWIEAQPKRS